MAPLNAIAMPEQPRHSTSALRNPVSSRTGRMRQHRLLRPSAAFRMEPTNAAYIEIAPGWNVSLPLCVLPDLLPPPWQVRLTQFYRCQRTSQERLRSS